MKVLILNQIPEVNNKYTFSLARELKNVGVELAVCGIETDNVSSFPDIEYYGLFKPYSQKTNPISKLVCYWKSWKRVFEFCISKNIEIVHTQWYVFSPLDWLYHKRLQKNGIKVVVTIHDLLPFNQKFYDFFFHKKIYMHADAIISQAQINEEELVSVYEVSKEKIHFIPHGHYMEFAEPATKEESFEYLNLPSDKPVILFFGQIKKVKGVGILISAMKDVTDKYPDAICLIAGKVWHDSLEEYKKLIDKYRLNNNIRLDIRYIDDEEIKYYFGAADVVALPYLKAYQSGVVFLAYAYEKPVVATLEGEFPSVIQNRKTGILVPSNSDKDLAEAIIWYLDNPEEAHQYALEGKNDIAIRYSWVSIAEKIIEIYKSCI